MGANRPAAAAAETAAAEVATAAAAAAAAAVQAAALQADESTKTAAELKRQLLRREQKAAAVTHAAAAAATAAPVALGAEGSRLAAAAAAPGPCYEFDATKPGGLEWQVGETVTALWPSFEDGTHEDVEDSELVGDRCYVIILEVTADKVKVKWRAIKHHSDYDCWVSKGDLRTSIFSTRYQLIRINQAAVAASYERVGLQTDLGHIANYDWQVPAADLMKKAMAEYIATSTRGDRKVQLRQLWCTIIDLTRHDGTRTGNLLDAYAISFKKALGAPPVIIELRSTACTGVRCGGVAETLSIIPEELADVLWFFG